MTPGGTLKGKRYQAAADTPTKIADSHDARNGLHVQNISTGSQVYIGGPDVTTLAGSVPGVLLGVRSSGVADPPRFVDTTSDGEVWAVAEGGSLDILVTIVR